MSKVTEVNKWWNNIVGRPSLEVMECYPGSCVIE